MFTWTMKGDACCYPKAQQAQRTTISSLTYRRWLFDQVP